MYKFPLQRLLALREQHEQAMALELARARGAADDERRRSDDLQGARNEAHASVAAATSGALTVGHLSNLSFALSQLGQHALVAEERAQAAEQVAEERREALTSAAQERQILDRLRSRRAEESRVETTAKDRQTMDAVALSRFTQASSADDDKKERQ